MAINLTRRQLLAGATVAGASALILGLRAFFQDWQPAGWLNGTSDNPVLRSKIRGGFFTSPVTQTVYQSVDSLSIKNKIAFELDLLTNKIRSFETSVPIHVVESHPFEPNLAAASAKRSNGLSILDFDQGREISKYRFPPGQSCSAHSAFTKDGKTLLAPILEETSTMTTGWVGAFEFPSLKLINQYRLPRGTVHDFQMLASGNEFVFGSRSQNGKGAGFGIFNLETQNVQYFDSQMIGSYSTIHLKRFGNRYLGNTNFLDSQGQFGPGALLAFDPESGRIDTVIALGKAPIHSEMLSLDYDSRTNFVWISLPAQQSVVIWDLNAQAVATILKFSESPSMISVIPESEVTVVGTSKRFYAIHSRTFAPMTALENNWPSSFINNRFCAHSRLA